MGKLVALELLVQTRVWFRCLSGNAEAKNTSPVETGLVDWL